MRSVDLRAQAQPKPIRARQRERDSQSKRDVASTFRVPILSIPQGNEASAGAQAKGAHQQVPGRAEAAHRAAGALGRYSTDHNNRNNPAHSLCSFAG